MDDPRSGAESAADPLIGRLIDGYRVEELVGAGGMGRVYRAHDTRLERKVAVKFLSRGTPEQQARFEREALAISAINHPNVAAIHTRGVYAGEPYYVMEYLDGGSLVRFLAAGARLPLARAADFLLQAAHGLAAACERGLIHRDVKPSNLMLQGSDRIKVVDFGLARRLDGDISLTETDTTLGTPHYISPEQALGKPTDHRSDIYSLGATFYHLLSGFPPFDAETPVSLLLQHVNSPLPPLKERNPRVPAAVCRVIERMMAKDPAHRFATYDELVAALEQAVPSPSRVGPGFPGRTTVLPVPAVPTAPERGRPATALLVVGALLVVIPILLFLAGRAARQRSGAAGAAAATPTPESAGGVHPASLGLPADRISPEGFEALQRLSAGDTSPAVLAAVDSLPGIAPQAVKAALRAKTMANMKKIAIAVEARMAQEMQEPPDLPTLAHEMGLRPSDLIDAWGRPIELEFPSIDEHRVTSLGPDGVRGTADDLVMVNGELEGGGLGDAPPRAGRRPAFPGAFEDGSQQEEPAFPTPPAPSGGR